MTDTTGDIYYSGQICRGSVALETGCGKCEKCKAEAEVKEEQLYICNHADPSCECMGLHYKPKHENDPMRYNGRCMNRGGIEVKSIPYTEEKEPKTKRVAVMLDGEEIPLGRLRYGTVKKGDIYLGFNSAGEVKVYTMSQNEGSPFRLIIDPTPEPETVDDLIFELSEFDSIGYDEIQDLVERLKSAQERSKS